MDSSIKERVVMPEPQGDPEKVDEQGIRPKRLDDFVGQTKIKDNLKIFIQAAGERKESLDHVLISGPPGLGKTTLANIIAHEMRAGIRITSGPVLVKAGDLAGLLTGLRHGDVLFIDEIHRLNRVVEEYLYPAMEDYSIDILIDSGPSARSVKLDLKKFTLIGATTRSGMLTGPLRSRFGMTFVLDYYEPVDLEKIILRSADILKINIQTEAAGIIAQRSRGTPRIANRLLRRARDFAQVGRKQSIDRAVVLETLDRLGVDDWGLDLMDKKILNTIISHYNGGPVGVNNIGVAVGEESETIEEVYEPYLIKAGFLMRTPRGRMVTDRSYSHLGIKPPKNRQKEIDSSINLFES